MKRRFASAMWVLSALTTASLLAMPAGHATPRALSPLQSTLAGLLADSGHAIRVDSRTQYENFGAGRAGRNRLGGSNYYRKRQPTYRRPFGRGDVGLSQPNRRGGYGQGRRYKRGIFDNPKGRYKPR